MKRFKNERGGIITWFRAWNAGAQTAFFVSLICAFFIYLSTALEPSLIDDLLLVAEQKLQASSMPSDLVENMTQQLRENMSPVMLGAVAIFSYSAIGCFTGFLFAFFVQKEPSNTESPNF
jgi:hypothetical protein